jgi:hypothetical protein
MTWNSCIASDRDNAFMMKDEDDNHHKVIIKIDGSDDENEGVLDRKNMDGEMEEPSISVLEGELMRQSRQK